MEIQDAQELSPWEHRVVEACDQYARLFPDDKAAGAIYKSAYLLYDRYRFEEAAERFRVVIQMDPSTEQAELAAELILDSLAVRESWQALEDNARLFAAQPMLGSAEFRTQAMEVAQKAALRFIEVELARTSDAISAADAYVAFAEEFGEAQTAALALNNASVHYHAADRLDQAMAVRHVLVDDSRFGPKTRFYFDQVGALGFDYETIADYGRVAGYYEQLWMLVPAERQHLEGDDVALAGLEAQASEAIYSAAALRAALRQRAESVENYREFVDAYPEHPAAPDAYLRMGSQLEGDRRNEPLVAIPAPTPTCRHSCCWSWPGPTSKSTSLWRSPSVGGTTPIGPSPRPWPPRPAPFRRWSMPSSRSWTPARVSGR